MPCGSTAFGAQAVTFFVVLCAAVHRREGLGGLVRQLRPESENRMRLMYSIVGVAGRSRT